MPHSFGFPRKSTYTSSFFSFPNSLCRGNIKPLLVTLSWFYEVILNLFKSRLQVNAFNTTHVANVSSFAYAIPTPCPQQGIAMALVCCAAFLPALLPKSCANIRKLGTPSHHTTLCTSPSSWLCCM